jgi:peptidoglycan/xylan/chitin deacetylase (PgdA/CDA1 family)
MRARSWVKSGVEYLARRTGVNAASRFLRRRQTLILAYHNIVPHGETPIGERSLHLPQQAFSRQLDSLQRTHRVVSLAQIGEENPQRRPQAVITFDDAYRGAMTAGVDELKRRNLPATVFATPGLFGQATWWDQLASASGEIRPDVRERALMDLHGRSKAVLQTFNPGRSDLPDWAHIASAGELRESLCGSRVTIGSHTWSHQNLEQLSGDELFDELSPAWLQEFDGAVPWLAYPYGRSSIEAERAAEKAGYRGAFRIAGGWLGSQPALNMFALPRLNVPANVSLGGFELRTAGLLRR